MQDYRALLTTASEAGYETTTLRDFYSKLAAGVAAPRTVILRHDADTDPARMADFLRVEQEFGSVGTYYFRLRTLDTSLMVQIEASGGEASYHYEEVATFAKRHRLCDATALRDRMPEIQAEFERNFGALKQRTGLPMVTVAAHGDFVNRRIGMANTALLDADVRRRCGIEVEAYDPLVRDGFACITDRRPPVYWTSSPTAAIQSGVPLIHLLTHPRHWGASPVVNAKDNLRRLWEGARCALH